MKYGFDGLFDVTKVMMGASIIILAMIASLSEKIGMTDTLLFLIVGLIFLEFGRLPGRFLKKENKVEIHG